MPKPNTKPHLRQYEVQCEGLSNTQEMAQHILDLEIALANRWIKGNPETLDYKVVFDTDCNFYRGSARVRYTDNRYKYDEK